MNAVSQFVRQSQNVVRRTVEIHFNAGFAVRDGLSVFSAFFSRAGFGIDALFVKERLRDVPHFGIEAAIGGQDDVFRFVKSVAARFDAGDGRVSVPVSDFTASQPFGFQRVETVRDVGSGIVDGRNQRVNDAVFDAV